VLFRSLSSLSSPLLPDDYLELVNPLWSTRELRGRVKHVKRETPDAATISIKPGYRWPGHEPGQYLRIGVDIDGVRHWRAYSLTSDPYQPDGLISVTVKNVDEGQVSPFLVHQAKPGTIVSLGGVEGDFVLPDETPDKLLFITAGSGITPIMGMLRHLDRADEIKDVVILHSARKTDEVIFGDELRSLDRRHDGFQLHEQLTGENGRMTPADLEHLCPDWLYAIGDVNGRALLTHMGKYQARIAADVILGYQSGCIPSNATEARSPRVIFTDPQVAAVGYTLEAARRDGVNARVVDVPTQRTAGASFYGRDDTRGTARLVVDDDRNLIVGATITGPEIAEFLQAMTIAVVGEVTLDRLFHAVPAFPTRSEVWLYLLEALGVAGPCGETPRA